jgi:hypothetical protein
MPSDSINDIPAAKLGSCPYCASRLKCFICNSSSQEEKDENTKKRGNPSTAATVSPLKSSEDEQSNSNLSLEHYSSRNECKRKDPVITQTNACYKLDKPVIDIHHQSNSDNDIREENQRQYDVVDLTDDARHAPLVKRRKNSRYSLRDKDPTTEDTNMSATFVIPTNTDTDQAELNRYADFKLKFERGKNNTEDESESEYSRFSKTDDDNLELSDFSDIDDDLNTKPTASNGLSAYEQLRLDRIQRNNAKLVG